MARTKERFATQIETGTADRVRAAVYAVQGLTLTELTDKALRRYVATIERKHNSGEPFPPCPGLPAGRRVGGRA